MTPRSHREFTFYSFGLRAGLANLRVNGLELGLRKTAGKITQPVNSYTRFPEYHWFDLAIRRHLAERPPGPRPAILDVGSPKLFGLYLASSVPVDLTLTDISELNIDEYRTMWKALARRAKGQAGFALADARSLPFAGESFDVVYSMSVLEHIEGARGDSAALAELLRVLKPGGLLVFSVPFGERYVEQRRIGFSGAVRKTGDQESYFFQRIYDAAAAQARLLAPLHPLRTVQTRTVWRSHSRLTRTFAALGENIRGLLGSMNPIISVLANHSAEGIAPSMASQYSTLHTAGDIYGDLIVSGAKS